jgi:hypothetical protein
MSILATLLSLLCMALFPAGAGADDEDWTLAETATKTFHYAAPASGPLTVEVDTYAGAIHVRAGGGASVEATVRETVRAASPARAAQARKEVTLQAGQEGGLVRFFVDGPFRCDCGRGWCGDDEEKPRSTDCRNGHGAFRSNEEWPYEVAYDFEIAVPAHADLTLRTVNRGDIAVEGVEGTFTVRNVNGEIRLERVAGSGSARTVNGGVTVDLTRGPADSWRLQTVNGDVELRLPPSAGIDARVETMNGEAWSDFPYTQLPPAAATRHERDGRWVYRREGSRLRLGPGGPQVAMETLNGDIRIRKNTR